MKNRPIHILACSIATLGTLAFSALAQNASPSPSASPGESPQPGDHPHPPVPPLFRALDPDKDGTISATEMSTAPASLRTLDANHDGQLSPGELHPKRGERPDRGTAPQGDQAGGKKMKRGPGGGPGGPGFGPGGPGGPHGRPHGPEPLVRALDTDEDGIISASEIANASASLKTLDKNSDGQLTRDELRPQGPPPPMDGGPESDDQGAPPPPPEEQN